MTHTLQELDALHAAATQGPWGYDPDMHSIVWRNPDSAPEGMPPVNGVIVAKVADGFSPTDADLKFIAAARSAIPELVARIRELDPAFHAEPVAQTVERAMQLSREAAAKRSRLDQALREAKLGDLRQLNELGLEAFFDDDGKVKIRPKRKDQETNERDGGRGR